MQTSSQPKLLPIPFANAGSKQDIPNDSQVGIVAGRASYSDGFPPLTRTPLAAGGVPPFGTDFNGVLNDITAALRWSQAGAGYPFNAEFNTAVSGYPKGARIPNSTLDGFWLNTADGNSTNPENATSALTGWVPSGVYGVTAISGLSGSSVRLTSLQASRDCITLAGVLTANINLVVPAWIKRWEIVNNCTGEFSVTVKTPSGSGVSIPAGGNAIVQGDGTNINQGVMPGALLNVQVLVSSGTYTPTPGTKKTIIEMVGGGGASGGTPASSSGSNFASGGAGSGAYIKFVLDNPVETQVTIGKGGVVSGGTGLSGGATSFGDIATVGGGGGSAYAQASGGALLAIGGNGGGAISATGRRIVAAVQGERGGSAVMINGGAGTGNNGASSPFGRGGTGSGNGNGGTPTGYGSGAGGAMRGTNNTGQPSVGAAGADGLIVVWEYS